MTEVDSEPPPLCPLSMLMERWPVWSPRFVLLFSSFVLIFLHSPQPVEAGGRPHQSGSARGFLAVEREFFASTVTKSLLVVGTIGFCEVYPLLGKMGFEIMYIVPGAIQRKSTSIESDSSWRGSMSLGKCLFRLTHCCWISVYIITVMQWF